MSIIANNLRWIRKKQNISQTEFANVFGITRASVGAYEEGRAEPKLELLMKITKYYQLELSTFIEREFNPENRIEDKVLNKPILKAVNSVADENYIQEFLDVKPSSKNMVKSTNSSANNKRKVTLREKVIPFYRSAKNKEELSTGSWPFFDNCDAVFECNPLLERENPIYKDGFVFMTSKIDQEGLYKGSFIQKEGNRLILTEDELIWDKSSFETWKIIYVLESITNFKL